MKKFALIFLLFLLLSSGCKKFNPSTETKKISGSSPIKAPAPLNKPAEDPSEAQTAAVLTLPMSNAKARLTKKFFGTFVTPKNSPVSEERFTGYHTGLDFETFPEEQNTAVSVKVICSGKLLQKGYAKGYGGYAVQACNINSQTVTVVYGHLRQLSIKPNPNDLLNEGSALAVLGTGFSAETDGERKHLHLSIHKGAAVNIKGYVQNKIDLVNWLDPQPLLGL